MKDFLLFCHYCKKEFIVDVEDFKVTVIKNDKQSQNNQGKKKPDARRSAVSIINIHKVAFSFFK